MLGLQVLGALGASEGCQRGPGYCWRGPTFGPMRTRLLAEHRRRLAFMQIQILPGIVAQDRPHTWLAGGREDPQESQLRRSASRDQL